jgi:YggT family protein
VVLLIQTIFQILTIIIIVDALVSFILPPYHAIRSFLDKIVNPMLNPIRRVVPAVAGMDFSPIILLLLFQLLEYLLVNLVR